MSTDEMVKIVYGYSWAACKTTHLDYRDVAHMVIIRLLPVLRRGIIRNFKSYTYSTISSVIASSIRRERRFLDLDDIADPNSHHDPLAQYEVERLCQEVKPKERIIIQLTIKGYSRQEIADQLGMTRGCVNLVWFRMVKRERGIL